MRGHQNNGTPPGNLAEVEGSSAIALPRRRPGGEITAREHFDAEETAVYAADLDVQVEAQGVIDTAPNSNM
jgi:hypothetical protein